MHSAGDLYERDIRPTGPDEADIRPADGRRPMC